MTKSKSTLLTVALQPGGILTLESEPVLDAHRAEVIQDLEAKLEAAFTENCAQFLLVLGLSDSTLSLHPTLQFWREFSSPFARKLLLIYDVEGLRGQAKAPFDDEANQTLLDTAPPMVGSEYLTLDVLARYWNDLHTLYQISLKFFKGSVEDWFNSQPGVVREIGRIHFHLVENKTGPLPFAFMATYGSHGGSKGRVRHLPLSHALEEFEGDGRKQLEVLKSIHRAAKGSAWLKKLVASGEVFHPLGWTATQAHRFLRDVEVFLEAGILCRIPDWWRKNRKGIQLRIGLGEKSLGGLGLQTLLEMRPELTLDGIPLTEADLQKLAKSGEDLAYLRGNWVIVDAEKIKSNLELFQQARKLAKGKQITLAQALRLLAGTDRKTLLGLDLGETEIVQGAWLADLWDKMRNPSLVRGIHPGKDFKGNLRPYQQLGLNWLGFLHHLGFGGCLADDMGLGKTVQVLAFLQALKDDSKKVGVDNKGGAEKNKSVAQTQSSAGLQVLLVAPASLIRNWMSEFTRFTPSLTLLVAHPAWAEKTAGKETAKEKDDLNITAAKADVVITTYGMIERLTWIKEKSWSQVILDEGQAIKNSGSKQARAVKALKSQHRLILTGTPIENRLFDLWSLFDFINPGLLGSADDFRKRAARLHENPEAFGQLRRVIQPYILRRLKTDKSLLPDLPDKVERKVFAGLSRKQVTLYRALVDKLKASLDTAKGPTTGLKRQAQVLGFLMQFKQVCNHPDHFSGLGKYKPEESGKFELLRELCEPILNKHERMLIFTQFAEITEPLVDFLTTNFGRPGLLLTGSTPIKRRQELVDTFQGDAYIPFMVLSLKAGGTGLNLTRANHVVHFDRWWNPAVENQATDRAFRIGQTKNVMVHKFVTRGTLEEKIDAMIDAKASLARDLLPAGNEDWITQMTNSQIIDLFTLDAGAQE
jgi:SNF2 family DNA or RNA helicase